MPRSPVAAAVLAVLLSGCAGDAPQPAEPLAPADPVAPAAPETPPAPGGREASPPASPASDELCHAAHEFFVANAGLEEAPADASGDPELQARWDRQTAALDQLLQWAPGALESGLVRLRDASARRDLSAFDAVVVEEAGVLQELDVLCPLPAG